MTTHQEIYAALESTLQSQAVKGLTDLIRAGLADMDAGRETESTNGIRKITHQVYFDRTGFSNSHGREYIWIFTLSDAQRALRDNAPEKLCKYLSTEEATHWLRQAKSAVDDLISVLRDINA